MIRLSVVAALLLAGALPATSLAQRRQQPRPAARPAPRTPAPPAIRRPPPILIESRRAVSIVPLTGTLGGPVAIDPEGGAVFLAADGVLGEVAPDGNLRWSFLVGPSEAAPALGVDGTVYTAGHDGRLYAVETDGRLRFTRRLGGRPVRGVAVGADVLAVALANGWLELWRPDGERHLRLRLGGVPSEGAVLVGERRAAVPMRDGTVVAVDEGRVAWRSRVTRGAALGPLAVGAGGELFVGAADGTVAALRPDGTVAWRANAGGPVRRSPALAEDGTTLVATARAIVAYWPSGERRWRRDLGARVVAGPLIADDGAVYVALVRGEQRDSRGTVTGVGEIRAITPEGAETRIAVPAAPTRSLALGGGSLWVGLRDWTLRRIPVPQRGLARSSWAKGRGDGLNTGAH
jgi:hypothetical protein